MHLSGGLIRFVQCVPPTSKSSEVIGAKVQGTVMPVERSEGRQMLYWLYDIPTVAAVGIFAVKRTY